MYDHLLLAEKTITNNCNRGVQTLSCREHFNQATDKRFSVTVKGLMLIGCSCSLASLQQALPECFLRWSLRIENKY